MGILFINAAFRDGSRTLKLANAYLSGKSNIVTVDLGTAEVPVLNGELLKIYNDAVASHNFSHRIFDYAKQFKEADEIVIAAPFWNYTVPAILHAYLELVCSQGVTFDMGEDGAYHTLCKAQKITFITTAGGPFPETNHAHDYITDLATVFWQIPDIMFYQAENLDVIGTDVNGELNQVIADM